MKLDMHPKVPVEPLDRETQQRIENQVLRVVRDERLLAPRDSRPPRRWVMPGLVAAAATVTVLVGWSLLPSSERTATSPPTAIATSSAETTLSFGDATITLGPDSAVRLARRSDGTHVVTLDRGTVDCDVAPKPNRLPFAVEAADTTVTVVGTLFRVERDGDAVAVDVERGRVMVVAGNGAPQFVGAGESWRDRAVVATAELREQERVATTRPGVAPGDPANSPDAPADATPAPGGEGTSRSPGKRQGGTRNGADPGESTSSRPTRRLDDLVKRLPQPRLEVPESGAASDLAALRVARQREQNDPARAATWYAGLARKRSGRVASYALYSLAYVQRYRQRQRDAALRSAEKYIERFPQGAEAEAAHMLRLRLICEAGDLYECRRAGQQYADAFPNGNRAELIRAAIAAHK